MGLCRWNNTKVLLKKFAQKKDTKRSLTNSCTSHSTVLSLVVVLLQWSAVEGKRRKYRIDPIRLDLWGPLLSLHFKTESCKKKTFL